MDQENPAVVLPTTEAEALAAGVPLELFDPEVHLFTETVAVLPPRTTPAVNATEETVTPT